jgi:hypothetical protein
MGRGAGRGLPEGCFVTLGQELTLCADYDSFRAVDTLSSSSVWPWEVVVVEVLPERVEVAGHDVSRLRLGVDLVQLDVEGLITHGR